MVNDGRQFSNREYCDLFGVTYTTAFRDLSKL